MSTQGQQRQRVGRTVENGSNGAKRKGLQRPKSKVAVPAKRVCEAAEGERGGKLQIACPPRLRRRRIGWEFVACCEAGCMASWRARQGRMAEWPSPRLVAEYCRPCGSPSTTAVPWTPFPTSTLLEHLAYI